MRYFTFVFFILFTISSYSQILNVERLRKVTDTIGWSAAIALDFTLARDVNDFFIVSNDIHLQYKLEKHLFLLKNQFRFTKIEGEDFSNNGITHLRYNYKWKPRITWEAFAQGQYNKVSKINNRFLFGTGPRFKLLKLENYKFYLGTLIMYEHEELSDGSSTSRDFRGSAYFSFTMYPNAIFSFVSTTYYQPLLNDVGDYRIASESSVAIKAFKNFAVKMTYLFTYDETPAEGIQNSQYRFATGIVYSFN
ncbi:MAG: DUF481 domain-containing protein [Flavobacteriaceae bacterium]|nr:DUF481 domain-containing protein [Flavobacteriaceae bacterium]